MQRLKAKVASRFTLHRFVKKQLKCGNFCTLVAFQLKYVVGCSFLTRCTWGVNSLPYRKNSDGDFLIFLQKRKQTAQRAPGKFGFFGGGAENESEKPEDILIREIKEELNFIPEKFWYLGRYEFTNKELFAYCQQVDDGFETQIKIAEGDFGKWFSKQGLSREPELIDDDKPVFKDFFIKI